MQVRAAVVSVVVSGAFFFACVGEDPALSLTDERGDGGPGSVDGGSTDGGGVDTCAARCKDDDVLQDCTGNETRCVLGCVAATSSCKALDPKSAVDASELVLQANDVPMTLPSGDTPTIIDTSTGEMMQGTSVVRAANDDPTTPQTVADIGFVRRDGLAIFRARSWTLRNVYVKGAHPIAFVAPEEIKVLGHVTTKCGQVGAGAGGKGGEPQGDFSSGASGAGGGGNGTAGGAGGPATGDDDAVWPGGVAGPIVPFSATNLRGGGNGGRLSGTMGGGGGVVVLVSGVRIQVGDGSPISYQYQSPAGGISKVAKGINVGGCGGEAGDKTPNAAGGGGAGGTILLEAPAIALDDNAGLAANGGGGGGTLGKGDDAQLSDVAAAGGKDGSDSCFKGGSGGDGATGKTPAKPGNSSTCGEYEHAGAGGGGVGRILIRTRTATINVKGTSIQSPAPALEAL